MTREYIADKTTLDAMNVKIGANTDVAGSSTLFARLAQLSSVPAAMGVLTANHTTASASLQTALNITGPGILLWASTGRLSTGGVFKVTIDGNVIVNDTSLTEENGVVAPTFDNGMMTLQYGSADYIVLIPLYFKDSLLIQVQSDGSTNLTSRFVYAVS